MHKTGGFLHIQQILRCDTKRARRDKECAPQQMRLKKEKEASSMEMDNLFMRYTMQFGAEELPPRMQMPIEQQTDEFYNALLERCLKEGKPASNFITIEENPEVLY